MKRIRMTIIILVTLVCGFGTGILLRPIVMPPPQVAVANNPSPIVAVPDEARSTQYFEENIDEARQVAAACRDGTVRGDECTNAETAISIADSKERFKRFRGR